MANLKHENCNFKPISIAICYFPPINSVLYDDNLPDIDVFQCLEDSLCSYQSQGMVYVTGDLNARCGVCQQFIPFDLLNDSVTNVLQPFIMYENDSNMCQRQSMDLHINQFGRKLLILCNSSGLRFVNGRHRNDPTGSHSLLFMVIMVNV